MKELVTVIIPAYNCESKIHYALDSLKNQTLNNFEVLVIDDGSTDNTKNVVSKYLKEDSRIKYISKKNGGVSSARNLGIKESKGEYICFLDCDDYYDECFLEKMYKKISNNNADICFCGYNKFNENIKKVKNSFSNKFLLNYFSGKLKLQIGCLMIDRKFININSLFFDETLSWGEDYKFISNLLYLSKKTVFLKESLLFYNIYNDPTRLSKPSLDKVELDKQMIFDIQKEINLSSKEKDMLFSYRLPALILNKLYLEYKSNNVNIDNIKKEYKLNLKYINNFKFNNGLRSIKVLFKKLILDKVLIDKVYLKGYFVKNLGDDLFFKILTDRYPNTKFIAYSDIKYKRDNINKNLKIYCNPIFTIINKMLRIISKETFNISYFFKKRCNAMISIGGSIFYDNDSIKEIKHKIKVDYFKPFLPTYIIGSNINTKRNKIYVTTLCNNLFNLTCDVSLRDKVSFHKCVNQSNVRYAPDLVFSYDVKPNKKNNKSVIFSIIDCSKKLDNKYQDDYENKMIELIEKFNNKGYKVTLMSFCKYEGDENSIEKIIKKLNFKNIIVDKYYYDGNIEESIKLINNNDIVIGSRFHANILGLVMNKTIIPIIYNDKMTNVLDDISFMGKRVNLKEVNKFNVSKLTDEDLSYKCDIKLQKKESLNHFKIIDKVL